MSQVVDVTDRKVDGCMVLDVQAENFTYPQTSSLKNHVAHLLEAGERYFVIQLTGVRIIDSYGLATIISTIKMVKERGGDVTLCGLNDTFNHLLKVTHLDKILEVWPSEAQAVYYLSTSAKIPSKGNL